MMERLKSNIIPAEGPLSAKVCFVGQAPGAEEDRSGRPFVGAAGQLLNRALKDAELLRSEVLVNNVFAQRPPKNDVKHFFESYLRKLTWEGEEHVGRLKEWLERMLKDRDEGKERPNLLVALGAEALWALTGHKRITKWRGSVLPCTLVPGFKVYAMFHPSYVNRLMNEPEERMQGMKKVQKVNALPLFLIDLRRVKYQSGFVDFKRPEREFEFDLKLEEVLGKLMAMRDSTYVAVDIETIRTERGPVIWCIGFSPSPEYALTVPFLKRGRLVWSPGEEAKIWRMISFLMLDPRVKKIFHNGGYDLSILGRYYNVRVAKGSYEDTMWCFQSTYPYMLKGLDTLTSIYTWEPYYKDDGKYWDGRRISDETEFVYNGRDCCVTREIWPQVERDAKVHGTWDSYLNSIRVMPSLLRKMIVGVKVDLEKKEELGIEFERKAESAKEVIRNEAGFEVNPDSSPQVQRLLYGYMGMPIQYGHKSKKPSADKDAINRLRKKYSVESKRGRVLKALSDFRKFDKLRSTYTKMEVEEDGRIRTSYGFISTFRLSSSESHFGGGGNLQNIPVRTEEGRLIRSLFIPDPGLVLLASDLEQAEARVVAWDAEDLETMEAFLAGANVHWINTQKILGIPESEDYHKEELYRVRYLEEEKTKWFLRQLGKTVEYADSYGMGPVMLQNILIREEIYLELRVCKELLAARRRKKPLIVQWQAKIRELVRTTRTLTNPFGDKREFRGRLNDNLFRSAYAWIPQSTVGRILEFAIQRIHEEMEYYTPLLNVHDEVVGECRREDVERGKKDLRKRLEIPLQIKGRELIIPCSFKVGENWGDLKEVEG